VLSVVEQPKTYFAVSKTAGQTIAVEGADATKVPRQLPLRTARR
jgi:hypothetical protein